MALAITASAGLVSCQAEMDDPGLVVPEASIKANTTILEFGGNVLGKKSGIAASNINIVVWMVIQGDDGSFKVFDHLDFINNDIVLAVFVIGLFFNIFPQASFVPLLFKTVIIKFDNYDLIFSDT